MLVPLPATTRRLRYNNLAFQMGVRVDRGISHVMDPLSVKTDGYLKAVIWLICLCVEPNGIGILGRHVEFQSTRFTRKGKIAAAKSMRELRANHSRNINKPCCPCLMAGFHLHLSDHKRWRRSSFEAPHCLHHLRRQQNDITDDLAAFQQCICFSSLQDGKPCGDDRFDLTFFEQLEQHRPIV
jgi:hypothetical protein